MSALAFSLPQAHEASGPPETRGVARDAVKLMVADRDTGAITHTAFDRLPASLTAGDLVVINVSGTLPAAVPARRADGRPVRVHFATRAPELDQSWRVVELRTPDGARPERGRAGERLALGDGGTGEQLALGDGDTGERFALGGAELELVAPYASGSRLMLARFEGTTTVEEYLVSHGQPIRYGYVEQPWPLEDYQNVYAITPGSAEMPSAGRPLTARLITDLAAHGMTVAPITLHTGVSSPERHEPPFPEQYRVPAATARLVNMTRRAGGRVIAIGTTVVRALETVARPDGHVVADAGWTGLVIGPDRGVRAVDALVTGWHEPQASHLQMLAAIAGEELLRRSYDAALEGGYLWHEFGDSHLILGRAQPTLA